MNNKKLLENIANINLKASLGDIIGVKAFERIGLNLDVDTTSIPEDIWLYGGLRVFSKIKELEFEQGSSVNVSHFLGDANITTMTSSSALDVGQNILVSGLDENGYEVEQYVITNGQNQVQLQTPLWRLHALVNESFGNVIIGNPDTNIKGTVYITTNQATFTNGVPNEPEEVRLTMGVENRSFSVCYTVPRGKLCFLYKTSVGIVRQAVDTFVFYQFIKHPVGKNGIVQFEASVMSDGTSSFSYENTHPVLCNELNMLKFLVTNVGANNVGVYCIINLMTVPKDRFK